MGVDVSKVFEVPGTGGYGVTTDGFNWYVVNPKGVTISSSAYGIRRAAELAAGYLAGANAPR